METHSREASHGLTIPPAGGLSQAPAGGSRAEALLRDGPSYGFFQAVWLLEQLFPDAPSPGETADLASERIRFRPYHGMTFPVSDIRAIQWTDEETLRRVLVSVNFLGLYGVNAPLPVYLYDNIARKPQETEPLQHFLDIFNHRIYAFFYRTWKKYRPARYQEARKENPHARIFQSLAGLSTPGFFRPAAVSPGRLTAFAGFLQSRVRNAAGLRSLLSSVFEDLPVRVIENIERWVVLPSRQRLGGSASSGGFRPGDGAIVGGRVRDISGKFRLALGPLSFSQYEPFVPGAERATLLQYLVRLYAPDFLDYDVALLLRTDEVPPVRLGSTQRLGRDMWLGHPPGETVSVIVTYT